MDGMDVEGNWEKHKIFTHFLIEKATLLYTCILPHIFSGEEMKISSLHGCCRGYYRCTT